MKYLLLILMAGMLAACSREDHKPADPSHFSGTGFLRPGGDAVTGAQNAN